MNLTALPAFSDNYIWMLDDGRSAIIVDPGEPGPVTAALHARHLELSAILVTHHHADHCGGVDPLRAWLRGPVYGPARERIPQPCTGLNGADVVSALGMDFTVIDVPGHTAGHIAYFHDGGGSDAEPIVFSGDTLFSAGCGKLFEGTAEQMHESLERLAALPDATRVCCGHEYTQSNLRFARAVEPANHDIAEYAAWCAEQRANGSPTLPSTLARERRVNPFMRCDQPAVVDAARRFGATDSSGAAVLAALRQWKNEFR